DMQSSSVGGTYQGYQGYPYVRPIVTEIPTVDAQTVTIVQPQSQASNPYPRYQGYPYVNPIVTDVPTTPTRPNTSGNAEATKRDIDETPVVYIDMPEAGSEVSQSIVTPTDNEPEFVQDTIMYDPFENRRIDVVKDETRSGASSESGSSSSLHHQAVRPNTLNLAGASSSAETPGSSSSRQTPLMPSFLAKESQVYGGNTSDGFPLSPIPISEFPEPPPAYTETAVAQSPSPTREPVRETPREPILEPLRVESVRREPVYSPAPMTQVITSNYSSPVTNLPLSAMNYERKNLICHHCGSRVHTLVVKENGPMTHVIACVLFFMFPLSIFCVYCTDYFKYNNHYCPSCNNQIGYVSPVVGKKLQNNEKYQYLPFLV
ncbi:hypothetical protein HW555_005894, partial [Spodoptera exigua]